MIKRPRSAATLAPPLALAVVLLVVSSLGLASASATLSGLSGPHLVTSCLSEQGSAYDGYDPANGDVYVDDGGQHLFVVSSLCELVRTFTVADNGLTGMAYDPVTKEMVVANCGELPQADVFRGLSLVKDVSLRNGSSFACPTDVAWDGAIGAMLVSDNNGGVDLLYLTEVNGTTRAATIINAFDVGNEPGALLVADGYIFVEGNHIDVFHDRSLSYAGTFDLQGGSTVALAWDPLNDTVVMGRLGYAASQSLFFLNADGIAAHRLTFHDLPVHNILAGGVGGVAYSPFDHDVYFTAAGGSDTWALSPTGSLFHVFLGFGGMSDVVYSPSTHDLFVCSVPSLYSVS